jgi:putative membrane protein
LKPAAYIGGLLGLTLIIVLVLHADVPALVRVWHMASAAVLWVVPYRIVYFACYAFGWRALLRPFNHRKAGLGYILWVTTVREGVDRLLPVANVGGSVVGVRLLRWRGLSAVATTATIITEVVLTLAAVYLLGALGTVVLLSLSPGGNHHALITVLLVSLPIPVVFFLLLRYGRVFPRLERFLSPLVGLSGADAAARLDADLKNCLRREPMLVCVAALEFVALLSAAFEIWWGLRLFDHPVSASASIMLEGLSQAARHLAFIIPGGLGVQEGALVLFGHAIGISTELSLAISAVKRMREILCALPPLASWQWLEGRHLRRSGTLGSHARTTRGRNHAPRT